MNAWRFSYKKRHPKVPSSDLNHLNFNNMSIGCQSNTIITYWYIDFIEKYVIDLILRIALPIKLMF